MDKTSALVKWVVATPTVNSDKFEIEYSADGKNGIRIGMINISNTNQGGYQFLHKGIPGGNLYYRIKEIDIDGAYIYSNIVVIHDKNAARNYLVFPNPANNFITITSPGNFSGKTKVILYDAVGKQLSSLIMTSSIQQINTTIFPNGAYVLKIESDEITVTQKILIMHR